MKMVVTKETGFCFGVRRAIKLALETVKKEKSPIYTIGPLIHNAQVVERLEKTGVKPVRSLAELKEGILLIRSHGIAPYVIKEAQERGLQIIDATCPYVKKAQERARLLEKEGYKVIIVGEKTHPEVLGIKAFTERAEVVEGPGDIESISLTEKVGVVVQTTQSIENFKRVVSKLLEKSTELKIYNTICHSTIVRQDEARDLAYKVDLMIVVGGYNSANTRRLAEICKRTGTQTYHIEKGDELDISELSRVRTVGVTGGASTPEWIIKEVINKIREQREKYFSEKHDLLREEV